MKDEVGESIGFAFFANDITERKNMEQALRESEAAFRQLYDDAPVGYHELDTNGQITRVNRTELEIREIVWWIETLKTIDVQIMYSIYIH